MGIFFKDPPKQKEAPPKPVMQVVREIGETEFTQYFDRLMTKLNQTGMDFCEFKKILKANQNLPVDDKTKYTTTFEAFRAAGVTAAELMQSANFYLQKFSEENHDFNGDHSEAKISQVDDKEAHVAALKNENAKLSQQMADNNKLIAQLTGEVAQSRVKLATKKEQFTVAYENANAEINNIVNNIKTYLNGTT